MRIQVLGSGLEALATTLILRHNGFDDVQLIDAPTLPDDPVIELPPNATRVLYALGLKTTLENTAAAPRMEHRRSALSGYLLQQRPLGAFALDRYKAPHLIIATESLVALIVERLKSDAALDTTASTPADVVIIANGPDSTPRDLIATLEHQTTPWSERWLHSRAAGNTINFWLADGSCLRELPTPTDRFALHIGGASMHPRFSTLCELEESSTSAPVHDTEPLSKWYEGHHVVVGSAAHPLLPFTNQHFALTVEDAWVLARMLDSYGDDLSLALSEYQRYRQPRAKRVQAWARKQGRIATESRALQRLRRNIRYAVDYWLLPEVALQAEDWLYEYDCIKGFD